MTAYIHPLLSFAFAPALSRRQERFDAFVAEHRERAIRTAWRLVGGDEAAAEDVAQEAFLRAHRGLRRFRDEAQLSTWFYRILVRQASNYRRGQATRRKWTDAFTRNAATHAPAFAPSDPGLQREIHEALDALTPPQRQVFVLVHLEQFTVAEAASAMGCATGTAKSHLHRALKALRTRLEDHRPE